MALRISHILAYECEDGLLIRFFDTHNERDDVIEEAKADWAAMGHTCEAPLIKMDVLAGAEETDKQLGQRLTRFFQRQKLMNDIKGMLVDALMVSMLKDMFKDIGLGSSDLSEFLAEMSKAQKDGEKPTTH